MGSKPMGSGSEGSPRIYIYQEVSQLDFKRVRENKRGSDSN